MHTQPDPLMFERNRIDNVSVVTVAVEITLADGNVITGRAVVASSRSVHKLMDGPDTFLYIDQFSGEGTFVPKASIKLLKLVSPSRPQSLHLHIADATLFDPYKTLGIGRDAPWDQIKCAYHELTKVYHPDVYAAVALPPEVAGYLDGRMKQINTAFRLLKSTRTAEVAS